MNKKQKKEAIMVDIAENYKEFNRQAQYKLLKNSKLLNRETDYLELVSDILFTILNRLDQTIYINKYYNMLKENNLKLYIFKAIDKNCRSFSAPFLIKKVKIRKLLLNSEYEIPSEDPEYKETIEEEDKNIERIYEILSPPLAKEIFGDQWKYLVDLFLTYINDKNVSYRKLAKEYDCSHNTIRLHIKLVINKIKENI